MPRSLTALLLCTSLLAACDLGEPAIVTSVAGVNLPLSTRSAYSILENSNDPEKVEYAVSELARHGLNGDARALRTAIRSYGRGEDVAANPVLEEQLRLAALASGDDRQISSLVDLYTDPDIPTYDPQRAITLLEGEVETGDADVINRLARLLTQLDPPDRDLQRSAELYNILFQQGDTSAGLRLASMLSDPESELYDPQRAVALYEDLIVQGDGEAAYRLGQLYNSGTGVERDRDRALSLYEQGVVLGDSDATLRFAIALLRDDSVAQNEVRAINLFEELARNENSRGARLFLSRTAPERYIALVQRDLMEQGAYDGPITAAPDAQTLIAFANWCAQQDIAAECEGGLLERDAILAFSRSLQ